MKSIKNFARNSHAYLLKKRKVVIPFLIVAFLICSSVLYVVAQSGNSQKQEPAATTSEKPPKVEVVEPEIEMSEEPEKATEQKDPKPEQTPQVPQENSTDKSTDPVSLLVLVNKRNSITPLSYTPPNLTSPNVQKRSGATVDARAADALETMFAAAKDDGQTLMLSNGFRSYSTQQSLYNNYVQQDGQTAADTYSARPGHSEHQTGLAVDITVPSGTCHLQQCFGDMPEGKWLANNAYKYGFIIRYTKTNKAEAGYSYEPWHLRYIGVSNAQNYHDTNASSLESYLGKPAAPDYL